MKEFVYTIQSERPNFIDSMTEEESDVMSDHFDYLKALLEEKKLVMAGPCLDGAFGIVIIQSETEEAARELMENDPSVKAGVMKAELHPYRVSLLQQGYGGK
ncbi:YciI family protein [Halobacillus salinarum]|uniref:YciI family protein n=1 Tax=Halobacillus salinarum TaxID=2932257 RepID=A0ABY4EM54_9BACI|nr:YciI family protein [Halobacillus salinarum]UOQ44943.1 YciI family protein [Halobacillus salinarum]